MVRIQPYFDGYSCPRRLFEWIVILSHTVKLLFKKISFNFQQFFDYLPWNSDECRIWKSNNPFIMRLWNETSYTYNVAILNIYIPPHAHFIYLVPVNLISVHHLGQRSSLGCARTSKIVYSNNYGHTPIYISEYPYELNSFFM